MRTQSCHTCIVPPGTHYSSIALRAERDSGNHDISVTSTYIVPPGTHWRCSRKLLWFHQVPITTCNLSFSHCSPCSSACCTWCTWVRWMRRRMRCHTPPHSSPAPRPPAAHPRTAAPGHTQLGQSRRHHHSLEAGRGHCH
jgi:hypothetical protein